MFAFLARAIENGNRLLDVAAGGGLACLIQHEALALLADPGAEEGDPDMIRLDGARLVGELLRCLEMLSSELVLGRRQQLVDHFLDSGGGPGIAAIAVESLFVQVDGTLAGRRDEGAGSKGCVRTRQKRFELCVALGGRDGLHNRRGCRLACQKPTACRQQGNRHRAADEEDVPGRSGPHFGGRLRPGSLRRAGAMRHRQTA